MGIVMTGAVVLRYRHCTPYLRPQKPKGPTSIAEEQATTLLNLVIAVESERKDLQLGRAFVARRRELLSELNVRKEKEERSSSQRAELSRRGGG
jgi:translation initiation factor 3 subunit A